MLADGGIYAASAKIAVGGYDTVSYFRGQGKPVKDIARFKVSWKGTQWRFATAENAAAFKANPAAYDVVGGKLYLNYDQGIRAKWRKNFSGFIARGGANRANIPVGKTYGGSSWFGL